MHVVGIIAGMVIHVVGSVQFGVAPGVSHTSVGIFAGVAVPVFTVHTFPVILQSNPF